MTMVMRKMIDLNNEPDMDQVMLDLLVHEGFLSKQKMKNGKIWYKRTEKQLPKINKGDS